MLVIPAISLALAGSALAGPITAVRDPVERRTDGSIVQKRDAPAIKTMITAMTKLLTKGESLVSSYTAQNSAEKSKEIIAFIKTANKEMVSSATTLEATKPIAGVTSLITLLTPAKGIATSLESFAKTVKSKAPVVQTTPEMPKIADAVMELKPGSRALAKAVRQQIPESMIKQASSFLPAGMSAAPPSAEQMNKGIDYLFDAIVATIKGEEVPPVPEGILPPGVTLESLTGALGGTSKGKTGKSSDSKGAAGSSASDSAAAKAPKAAPKGKAGSDSGATSSSDSDAKAPKSAPKTAPKKGSDSGSSDSTATKAPKAAPKKGSDTESSASDTSKSSSSAKKGSGTDSADSTAKAPKATPKKGSGADSTASDSSKSSAKKGSGTDGAASSTAKAPKTAPKKSSDTQRSVMESEASDSLE